MGRFKATIGAACAAVLFTAGVAGAQGIVPDRTTYVTISAPVSVPGVVLPAGTYTFRLADTLASRNVVQIYDKDGSKIYATLITVAAERNEPSGDAVITFHETPADQPPALHFWYYAGEKGGHEFVYPKEQATQIAQRSGESVLAVDAASNDLENMRTGEISRVEGAAAGAATQPAGSSTSASTAAREPAAPESTTASRQAEDTAPRAPAEETTTPAPATAPAPMPPPSETTTAQARTPGTQPGESAGATRETMPRPTGTSGTSAPRELPRTASGMPLVGLVGFLALGAAFGVRALRRRVLV